MWNYLVGKMYKNILCDFGRNILMIHVANENRKNFEEYFKMYYQQALGYATRKVSNADMAEDLVMDAFVACHKNFEKFDETKAHFATWFYFILNNKIKNYYRDHKEHELLEDHLELTNSQEDELFTAIHIKELRELLAEALKELPDLQRKIVILKYFGNKTSNEIALECGLTPGNVRVQLSRTLDKLKSYFEKNNVTWE